MRAREKIERWLAGRGYTTRPGTGYAVYWEERCVTYRSRDSRETLLRGLLHECGHVLVGESRGASVRFKRGYADPRTGRARTRVSAADILHEELEAWHRGFLLARRLRIRLNAAAYWRDYGFCIRRYCKRVLERAV